MLKIGTEKVFTMTEQIERIRESRDDLRDRRGNLKPLDAEAVHVLALAWGESEEFVRGCLGLRGPDNWQDVTKYTLKEILTKARGDLEGSVADAEQERNFADVLSTVFNQNEEFVLGAIRRRE